jgi:hypothetical protein
MNFYTVRFSFGSQVEAMLIQAVSHAAAIASVELIHPDATIHGSELGS